MNAVNSRLEAKQGLGAVEKQSAETSSQEEKPKQEETESTDEYANGSTPDNKEN